MHGRSKCMSGLVFPHFRPARNDFNFGNKRKSHGARFGEHGGGGGGKTITFSFFKNALTIAEV